MRQIIGLKGLIASLIGVSVATVEAQQPLYGRSTVPATPAVTGIYDSNAGAGYAIYGLSRSSEGFAGFFRGRGYFSARVQIGGDTPISFAEMLLVNGNVRFVGNFQLNGALTALSSLDVGGALTVNGVASLNNSLTVGGLARFNQGVLVNNSPLTVTGATTLSSLSVSNATTLGSLAVNSTTTLNGGLVVNNAPAQFNQNVTVGANGAARNLTVNGNLAVSGNTNLNTVSLASLTITGANVQGTPFNVSGAAQFNSSVSIAQNLSVGGDTILNNVRVGSSGANGARTLRVIGLLETIGNANVTNQLTTNTLNVQGVSTLGGNVVVGAQNALRNFTVWGTSALNGNAIIGGGSQSPNSLLTVNGNTSINGTLRVNGTTELGQVGLVNLTVSGQTRLNTLETSGNVQLRNTLRVLENGVIIGTGNPSPNSLFTVNGNASVNGALSAGTTTLAQLTVNGTSTLNGNLTVANNNSLTVSGSSTLRGAVTVGAGTAVPNSLLTVGGNTTIRGTLTIQGDSDARQNALTINGNAQFNRDVTVGGTNDRRLLMVNGTLRVNGTTELGQVELVNLTVSGHTRLNTLETSGNVQLRNTLRVLENGVIIGTGNPSPNSLFTVNGNASVNGALSAGATTLAQLTVQGTSRLAQAVVIGAGAPEPNALLTVDGNATVKNTLTVQGATNLGTVNLQDLTVSRNTRLRQSVIIGAGEPDPNFLLKVDGALSAGATTLAQLTVNGTSTLNGDVTVADNRSLTVDGPSTLRGTVTIGAGNAAPNSLLTVNGTLTIGNNGDLSVARDTTLGGALTVAGNTALQGQVTVENRLEVSQETRLNTLAVNGETQFNQNVTVGAKGEPRTLEVKGNITLSNSGALVVANAGVNTPTTAFLFEYNAQGEPQNAALIAHPFLLAETNPNAQGAIVLVTFNGTNGVTLNTPYGVRYNSDLGGWEIYLLNSEETIPDGAVFNVLIILPSAPQQ